MKRFLILILIVAACASTLLVGCTPSTPSAPLPIVDDQTGNVTATIPSITVTGESELTVAPDMATLQLGIEIRGKESAEAALAAQADAMKNISDAMLGLGIEEKDIQTSNFQIYPDYKYDSNGNITGKPTYTVSNMLTVNINDIDMIGRVIDGAAAAGATNTYGLSFGLKDQRAKEAEALSAAMENARERADILAQAAGKKVGDVVLLSDGTQMSEQPLAAEKARSATGAAMDAGYISTGSLKVYANVSVRFVLE